MSVIVRGDRSPRGGPSDGSVSRLRAGEAFVGEALVWPEGRRTRTTEPTQPVYAAPPRPAYEVSDEMYNDLRTVFRGASEGGHGISRDMTRAQWREAHEWLGRRIVG